MLGAILTQKIKLEVKTQKLFIQTVRTEKKEKIKTVEIANGKNKKKELKRKFRFFIKVLIIASLLLFFMVGIALVRCYFSDPVYAQDWSPAQELVIRIQSIISPAHVDINPEVYSYIREHRFRPISGMQILNFFS